MGIRCQSRRRRLRCRPNERGLRLGGGGRLWHARATEEGGGGGRDGSGGGDGPIRIHVQGRGSGGKPLPGPGGRHKGLVSGMGATYCLDWICYPSYPVALFGRMHSAAQASWLRLTAAINTKWYSRNRSSFCPGWLFTGPSWLPAGRRASAS